MYRVARPVGRQLEPLRQPREPLLPVGEIGLEVAPAPLLKREVGVAERKRRQRALAAGAERRVERLELVAQERLRPAVGDDVVRRHDEAVQAGAEAEQPCPHERAGREVERPLPLLPERLGEPRLRHPVDLLDRQLEPHLGLHDLHGLARDGREARPQALVAGDERVEGAPERVEIEVAPQHEALGDVVLAARPFQLVQEPEPLLRVRERGRGESGLREGQGHRRSRPRIRPR
jgi:hypothetical protein